jgi:hypothetical protein
VDSDVSEKNAVYIFTNPEDCGSHSEKLETYILTQFHHVNIPSKLLYTHKQEASKQGANLFEPCRKHPVIIIHVSYIGASFLLL